MCDGFVWVREGKDIGFHLFDIVPFLGERAWLFKCCEESFAHSSQHGGVINYQFIFKLFN